MAFRYLRAAIATVGSAIALFLAASPSNANQCDNLIGAINQGIEVMEGFEAESKSFEAAAIRAKTPDTLAPIMNEFASALDRFNGSLVGTSKTLGALNLSDDSLAEFQQQYSTEMQTLSGLFGQLAQSLRDMGTVLSAIADTPPDQITPTQAQQWQADVKKAEADVAAVEQDSKTTTTTMDKIADDINAYCDREPPKGS